MLCGCTGSAGPAADIRLTKDAAGQVVIASLIGKQVTDADVKKATEHSGLTELHLQECSKVTGTGLGHLKGQLPKLGLLELVRVPIDDAALESLATASALSDLTLAHTNVTGSGLASLASCPISKLTVVSRVVTADGMKALAKLAKLKELELQCQDLQLKDCPFISELKELKKMVAYRTPVGKGGLASLQGLANLEYLHLNSSDIGDDAIDALNSLVGLEWVAIDSASFTNEGIKRLKLPKLKHLSLDSCRGVTDEGLGYFVGSPAIESLMLGGTGVTGVDLTPLSNLPNLKEVKLLGNQFRGNDDSIKALKAKLPNCEVFIMRG